MFTGYLIAISCILYISGLIFREGFDESAMKPTEAILIFCLPLSARGSWISVSLTVSLTTGLASIGSFFIVSFDEGLVKLSLASSTLSAKWGLLLSSFFFSVVLLEGERISLVRI